MRWLSLWTHSKKPSHQFQTYVRLLTFFLCHGCASGCGLTMLLPLSLSKLLRWFYCKSWVILSNKPQCYAVIEALDSFIMTPTSVSNICKVFDNLHMLWMYIWVHLHLVSASCISKASQILPRIMDACPVQEIIMSCGG